MRNGFLSIAILSAFFAYFGASEAFAYRAARIGAEQTELKDGPSSDAGTKTMLSHGTRVNTSDQATNGYYRVRSATDTGWVQESDLDFSGTSASQPKHAHREERMEDRDQNRESEKDSTPSQHYWILKAFGGLDFWSTTDLNNVVGSTGTNGGAGFGAELDYGLSKDFFLGFRLERLSKTATGPAGTGTNPDTVSVEVASTPVMAGLGWKAAKGENFSLDFGGYLGFGLGTGVTSTDTSQPTPNVTSLSASSATFLITADLNWQLSEPFWLYAEAGYRYLKTSSTTPGTVGAGQSLFENSAGTLVPFDVNLSGPVLNFGARINF